MKTNRKYTNQTAYNTIRDHLLQQGRKSLQKQLDTTGGGGCAYRGNEGRKCAIGALMPDNVYVPDFEGCCVETLFGDVLPAFIERRTTGGARFVKAREQFKDLFEPEISVGLLDALQGIHDSEEVSTWATKLREAALKYGLEP